MYNKSRLSKYSDLRQNAGTNNETTEVDSDRLSDYASRIERITNQKAADNMAFRGENNYTPNRSRSSSADGYAGFNGSNANASSANYFSAEPDYDKLVKEQEDFLKRIDNDFSAATSRSGTASYNQQPAGSGSQSVSSSPNYNYGSNNSYQPVNNGYGNAAGRYENPTAANQAPSYRPDGTPVFSQPSYSQAASQQTSYYNQPNYQSGYQPQPNGSSAINYKNAAYNQGQTYNPGYSNQMAGQNNAANTAAMPANPTVPNQYSQTASIPNYNNQPAVNNTANVYQGGFMQPQTAQPTASVSSYSQSSVKTNQPYIQPTAPLSQPVYQQSAPVIEQPVYQQPVAVQPVEAPVQQSAPVIEQPAAVQPVEVPVQKPEVAPVKPIFAEDAAVSMAGNSQGLTAAGPIKTAAVQPKPITAVSADAEKIIGNVVPDFNTVVVAPDVNVTKPVAPVEIEKVKTTEAQISGQESPAADYKSVIVPVVGVKPVAPVAPVQTPAAAEIKEADNLQSASDSGIVITEVLKAAPAAPEAAAPSFVIEDENPVADQPAGFETVNDAETTESVKTAEESEEIDDMSKVFNPANVDNTTDEYINFVLNDVKKHNVDSGIRSDLNTSANIFEAMGISVDSSEKDDAGKTGEEETAPTEMAADSEDSDTSNYSVDDISNELSKMFSENEEKPDKPLQNSSVLSPFGPNNSYADKPVQPQPAAVEETAEPEQPAAAPAPLKEVDDLTGKHNIVYDDNDSSVTTDINHLNHVIDNERALRQDMLEQTKQLKLRVSEYENEVTDMNSSMSRTNRVLNFVLTLLIITLFVILFIIAYWFAQERGLI